MWEKTVLDGSRKDAILESSGNRLELINKLCLAQAKESFEAGRKEVADAVLEILENPKQVGYRLKEIAEYCESKLKVEGYNERRRQVR